jgi:4-hydroxy-tetrahydrodipicolinate synthase
MEFNFRNVRLVPILATPFTQQGAVDYASLRRLVAFQVRCGVDGLGLLGSASEVRSLNDEERMRIVEEVAAEVDGRVPLIGGIGWGSARPVAEQAKTAAASGAGMLMVMPPESADHQEVLDFYRATAEASPVPLMIQHAPQLTGTLLPRPLLERLFALNAVQAIKIEAQPTPLTVTEAVAAAAGRVAVFGGQNALFVLEELERGAVGTMPACEFSDALRRMLDLYFAGAEAEARALFNLLLPLIRYGLQPGIAWAIHKEVLRLGGVIATNVVRPPALPLDDATAARLRIILTDLAEVDLAVLEKAVL